VSAGGGPVNGDSALWQSVPLFSYTESSTRSILERQVIGLAVLLAWLVGAVFVAYRAVQRVSTAVEDGE
jgi:hypothetical protein